MALGGGDEVGVGARRSHRWFWARRCRLLQAEERGAPEARACSSRAEEVLRALIPSRGGAPRAHPEPRKSSGREPTAGSCGIYGPHPGCPRGEAAHSGGPEVPRSVARRPVRVCSVDLRIRVHWMKIYGHHQSSWISTHSHRPSKKSWQVCKSRQAVAHLPDSRFCASIDEWTTRGRAARAGRW